MSNEISWRDKLAIVHAEILAVWLIAVDLHDRPASVTEAKIERLTLAVHRLEAIKGAA